MAVTIRFIKDEETRKLELTQPMRIGGRLFLDGFTAQAKDEATFGVALAGGVWQGMKYKGDIWRGIKAGALLELSMCTLNGIKNVCRNYRKEKKAEREGTYKIVREEE